MTDQDKLEEYSKLKLSQQQNNTALRDVFKREMQDRYDTQKHHRATKLNSFPSQYIILVVDLPKNAANSDTCFKYVMGVNYAETFKDAQSIAHEFCKRTGFDKVIIQKFGEWIPLKSMTELSLRQENRSHPAETLEQIDKEFKEEYNAIMKSYQEHEKQVQLSELETIKQSVPGTKEYHYDTWASFINIARRRHLLEEKLQQIVTVMNPQYIEIEKQVLEHSDMEQGILEYAEEFLTSTDYSKFKEDYIHFKNVILDHQKNK